MVKRPFDLEALVGLADKLRRMTPEERRQYLDELGAMGGKPALFAAHLEREMIKGPEKFWPAPKVIPE